MRILLAAALAFAVMGCASSPQRDDGSPKPKIAIEQTTRVQPIRTDLTRAVPVDYSVSITNPLDTAVTLKSLEIETVGLSGSYAMKRVKHAFSEVIPAKGSQTIAIRAWVQPLQEDSRGSVVSPVKLRGTARFDSEGKAIWAMFAENIDQ